MSRAGLWYGLANTFCAVWLLVMLTWEVKLHEPMWVIVFLPLCCLNTFIAWACFTGRMFPKKK